MVKLYRGRASHAGRSVWTLSGTIALLTLIIITLPANAITFGVPDSTHTFAGLTIVDGRGFCSGSLVSTRVFLTAGHCTIILEERAIGVERIFVSFAQFPFEDPKSWRAVASYKSHPELSFLTNDWHDLGVIILKRPVRDITPVTLAPVGYLDVLQEQGLLKDAIFANLGYGRDENLQRTGDRRISFSGFNALLDPWLYMSQNNALSFGGTCFGDSGGPTLHNDGTTEFLVAITSWGDAVCVATNNNYRTDITSSHEFIEAVIASTL